MAKDFEFEELRSTVQFFHPDADFDLIRKAVQLAKRAHAGVRREDGQLYFAHPFEVARTCAVYRMDDVSVAAALLHDTVEDDPRPAEVGLAELRQEVGPVVTELVHGLTKLGQEAKRSYREQKIRTLHWILTHAAEINPRTLVIKIFDRYHNLQSLSVFRKDKQQRIAWETVQFYIPLARRLGLYEVTAQMEDFAFRYINPEVHQKILRGLKDLGERNRTVHEQMVRDLEAALRRLRTRHRINIFPKHTYEISQALAREEHGLDELGRVTCFNLEICLPTVGECYRALGGLHALYRHLPWRIRDFIANPKVNGYQSIHTFILDPQGNRIQALIRTDKMAEEGLLGAVPAIVSGRITSLDWLRSLVSDLEVVTDDELLDFVRKLDVAEIDVFTPEGRLIKLPEGASALDFAYAIHSDVGHHARSVEIGGLAARLAATLTSGQTVRVLTDPAASPKVEWLRFAHTTRAHLKIRQWLRAENSRGDMLGARFVLQLLGKLGFEVDLLDPRWGRVAGRLGYPGQAPMLADLHFGRLFYPYFVRDAIGESELAELARVTARLTEQNQLPEHPQLDAALTAGDAGEARRLFRDLLSQVIRERYSPSGHFKVSGIPFPMPTSRARCCGPGFGDPIVGLALRARGVMIHKEDCENIARYREFESPSLLPVVWLKAPEESRFVLQVVSRDRVGLVGDLSQTLAGLSASISYLNLVVSSPDNVKAVFKGEFLEPHDRAEIVQAIRRIEGVRRVQYHEAVPGT